MCDLRRYLRGGRQVFQLFSRSDLDAEVRCRLVGRIRRSWSYFSVANYKELAATASLPVYPSDYIERALRLVAEACRIPGRKTSKQSTRRMASQIFLSQPDFRNLLEQLSHSKLVSEQNGEIMLTLDGWREADRLMRVGAHSKRAFVAMSFDPQLDVAFRQGFATALTTCGYAPPYRVSDPEHDTLGSPQKIEDRIMASIRQSRLVIADATFARPNVFYEAGFAEGLQLPVFWCCARSYFDSSPLPFDTRQHECIIWSTPEDIKRDLVAKLVRRGMSHVEATIMQQ